LQALLLQSGAGGMLQDTVFGFQAVVGGQWDLPMDLPPASLSPEPTALASLTPQQRQVMF